MGLFGNQKKVIKEKNFQYLDSKSIYLDSACQTLRPQQTIDAMEEYFHEYNACGGRVKYEWGLKVDEQVLETRKLVLSYLGKSNSEYVVAFTLNTSYGINLILNQLPNNFKKIVTSEIEHNSVFLPTITTAKRLKIPRVVLSRKPEGDLDFTTKDLSNAIVVLNSMSNFDGRALNNINEIAKEVHKTNGILIIDAAQSISHGQTLLKTAGYDALVFSSHKFYGPSLGVIVIKRSLLSTLDLKFIGGGTVEDVEKESYKLISTQEDAHSLLEVGLQNFAGIIGLGASIKWLEKYKPENLDRSEYEDNLAKQLFEGLKSIPTIKIINQAATPITSFYSQKLDGHKLSIFLSAQDIMVRSGYFCCHYFLKNKEKYPPLVRVSLGLYNNKEQVERFLEVTKTIISNT